MLPSSKPQDVYSEIAAIVEQKRAADEKNGKKNGAMGKVLMLEVLVLNSPSNFRPIFVQSYVLNALCMLQAVRPLKAILDFFIRTLRMKTSRMRTLRMRTSYVRTSFLRTSYI